MHRNLGQCPHCEKRFARITEQTPLVNRSDGMRFHVTLFAGPNPRPKFSGGFYNDQVICQFAYAHDRFGLRDHTVSVVIDHAEEDPEKYSAKLKKRPTSLQSCSRKSNDRLRFTRSRAGSSHRVFQFNHSARLPLGCSATASGSSMGARQSAASRRKSRCRVLLLCFV